MIYVTENGKEFSNKNKCFEYGKMLLFDIIREMDKYAMENNLLTLVDNLDFKTFCRINTITEEEFVKSVKELEKILKAGE